MKQGGCAWWPHTEDERIASFRLRCFQVVNFLNQRGLGCSLYRAGDRPDVLILSKRYDQRSVAHALTLRDLYGTKIVLDLCDNHFYTESYAPKWKFRAQELHCAIVSANHVVCSTAALADYVRLEVGEKPISVIGDAAEEPFIPLGMKRIIEFPSEVALWVTHKKLEKSGIPVGRRLVWFGNHGSGNVSGGMEDLLLVKKELLAHNAIEKISLTVISNNKNKYLEISSKFDFECSYLEWNQTTFSRAMQLHGIALIPIKLNPFTSCKTNNRISTAVKHGLAVAASSIPSYEIFNDDICLNDWEDGLDSLMRDERRRADCVSGATEILNKEYSLRLIAEQWRTMLELVNDRYI